jgi:hypothetical protein
VIPEAVGTGWIGGIASGTTSSSALLMATYLTYRSKPARALLLVLVPSTVLIKFLSGSKTAMLMPIAMIVMTWIVVNRQIRVRWVLGGLIALSLLYPTAQFWRDDILQRHTLTIADVVKNPGPALRRTALFLTSNRPLDYFTVGFQATARRLDGIGIASVIIRDTPGVSPFQHGRTLALIPVAFVPRFLWPDKPVIPIGRWISETYAPYGYLTESNLAATWIGEFYLNFGLLGIMGGMFVIGVVLRLLNDSLMRRRTTILMQVLAAILIATLMMGIQEAVVRSVTIPILLILPIFVVHYLMRIIGAGTWIRIDSPRTE